MNKEIERHNYQRQALEQIIAREIVAEERVRKAALLAWSLTFGQIPMLGITFFLMRTMGGSFIEAVRAVLLFLLVSGTLCLFIAVMMTVAWLFRSRAPTLTAIEQRLAALETILSERQ